MKINTGVNVIDKRRLPKAEKANAIAPKTLIYGPMGFGKTRTIAHLLLRNHTVFMIHCGIGPTGVLTIRSYLTAILNSEAKADALLDKHFRHVRIVDTDSMVAVAEQGWDAVREAVDDDEFTNRISVIAIEEINTLQARYEYGITPMENGVPRITRTRSKSDEADGSYGHFGDLKIGTEWIVGRLIALRPPDREIRHVWTCHAGITKAQNKAGETGPALQTRAILAIIAAFDYVVLCEMSRSPLKEIDEYSFIFRSTKAITKVRGEGWPAAIKADPDTLWRLIEQDLQPKDIPENLTVKTGLFSASEDDSPKASSPLAALKSKIKK